jgi:hypothetical protein
MIRTALAILIGLVVWAMVVTAIDIGLRHILPGYKLAEPAMAFTLGMKIARLLMAAFTSLAAGAAVRLIAPASRYAPWIVGLVLLGLFLPIHIHLGARFPLWYHLAFLLPLVPLVVAGARIRLLAR